MASVFEQRSAYRKFIYFGIILLLFTGSLMHRKLVINAQAEQLLLRGVGRGKADLPGAALQLTLSGIRGVAVTSLWIAATEAQKHHDWNELELIIDSLMHLQPGYAKPWLHQGWNLAFNVSVECDRVRDKYYYITRGITLLCRGEEMNDPGRAKPPRPWPANPDWRFEIADTYQRKIGQGDESRTLRCLFDLSCIPASERSAERFYTVAAQSKQINLDKFRVFCESHPRLVRRLRERLSGFGKPEDIIQFLADNKDIPARITNRSKLDEDQRLGEFPILPPQDDRADQRYPDWRNETLGSSVEDFDVFVCTRAWHTYAQIPLPPPNKDAGAVEEPTDRLHYRLPRFTTMIFRHRPVITQVLIAEELQRDGWFDDSGWRITEWFDGAPVKPQFIVGAGSRYDSALAWNKAYEAYRQFGLATGMYLEPEEMKKLQEAAARPGADPFFGKKLAALHLNRGRTRFDVFFQQTKVERTAEAVAARKAVFDVERQTQAGAPSAFMAYHSKVLPQWLDLLLRYPEFRQLEDIQETAYGLQLEYFRQLQKKNEAALANLVRQVIYAVPTWPFEGDVPPLLGMIIDVNSPLSKAWWESLEERNLSPKPIKVMPLRDIEGLFDQFFLLERPEAEVLIPLATALGRQALWPPPPQADALDFAFSRYIVWPAQSSISKQQGSWPLKEFLAPESATMMAGAACGAVWPLPTCHLLNPSEERRVLTQLATQRKPPAGEGWMPLFPWEIIQQARGAASWMHATVR